MRIALNALPHLATMRLLLFLASFVLVLVQSDEDMCNGHFYDVSQHKNFHLLPMDVCGENNGDRIIGGQTASLGEFPWMVRMGYQLENCTAPDEFRCGGALITETVVVTAAHCLTNLPINRCKRTGAFSKYYPTVVRLGEHAINSNPDCVQGVCAEKVQDIAIKDIVPHPQYNSPKLRNDIGLVRLKKPAVFNGWVNTLCLVQGPRADFERFLNHTGIVAGWGIINTKTGESSKELMMLRVPIVDIAMCIKAYDKLAKLSSLKQMCAGGIEGQDSCSGDSGGPLFIIDDTDTGPRYHILGIVSFGFKLCAAKPLPAVYTNFLFYAAWILDNLN